MILLTDTQSRLVITAGSLFLGTVLLLFSLISGNNTVIPPDFRASEEYVNNHKISNATLTQWIVEGKRNFFLVGFRSESECLLQSGITRHFRCYDMDKINDLFWIRRQFPHLKAPMVVYGSDAQKSFQAAVRMHYYGYDARMLVNGFEGYYHEYLIPPIRKNSGGTDQAAVSDPQTGYRSVIYRYLTDQKAHTFGSSEPEDSLYLPSEELPVVTGRVQSVFRKSQIVQITDTRENQTKLIRFDRNTKFIHAASHRDLIPGDIVQIKLWQQDRTAHSITRKIVPLQPRYIIKTKRLADSLMRVRETFLLVDIRHKWAYDQGHIPTAVHIRPNRLLQHLSLLKHAKTKRVILYGDGPTQPEIGEAFDLLQSNEYQNIKVYTFGMQAWHQKKQLVVINSQWLAKNLDPHHVVIDTRPAYLSQISHIKTAIPVETGAILRIGQEYDRLNTPVRARYFGNLKDKSAPIILYGIKSERELPGRYGKFRFHPDVIDAYDELIAWNYQNVAVLEGGFNAWRKSNPIIVGPNTNTLDYQPLQKKGSIPFPTFASIQKKGAAIILDVRTNQEVADGMVQNAVHIPLETLDRELPQASKSQMIVAYCSNGFRARSAYDVLLKHGFQQAYYVNVGIIIKKDGSFYPK